MFIINILVIIVISAYILANIIQSLIAIDQGDTFKELINYSQDTKFGRVCMSIFYFPVYIVLKVYSCRKIGTKWSFEDLEDDN